MTQMTMKQRKRMVDIILFIILSLGAVIMLLPLIWMLSTSIKTKTDALMVPPKWIPDHISFKKFSEIWDKGPLLSGIQNSLIVSLTVTIIGTFTTSLAAFSFAKLKFPHKDKIFLALLGTMMIPFPVIIIPLFSFYSHIGWIDTLLPLIVPGLFGNIVMMFFLRQYISGIPDALIEAAKIDGCSYFGIFTRIIFPSIKPAVAAQLILWFMGVWNDYLGPVIFLSTPEKQTIQVVIANFNATYAIQTDLPLIMAASLVAMLPLIVMFMAFQKFIIESIVVTGIKG